MRIAEGALPRSRLMAQVTGGLVSGVQEGATLAWRGIPYAAPPVGPLRFRSPHPVESWHGVRDASGYGNVAPQVRGGQFKGASPNVSSGEDCLNVNVFVRDGAVDRGRAALPVIVFIHGGGYAAGSSQDFPGQGASLVRTGRVVYVSFNYRLGALGYLDFSRYATPARPIDSNLGLRDQIAALEWVRDNIAAFGGDPHNVTLMGQSAGANAVTTLLTTPSARGLFARAIAQSPPANAAYSRAQAGAWAGEFVDNLGRMPVAGRIGGQDPLALLDGATPVELTTAALALQISTPEVTPGTFCLAPVIDGDLLPERPLAAFQAGRSHPVPLVVGTTEREGSLFRGRIDILPRSPARLRALIRQAPPGARPVMRAAYPGLPSTRVAADFGGDYAFWYPSVLVGDRHSRVAPVYAYRFDIAPRMMRLLGMDATHGIDLFALFDRADDAFARTMTVLGGREQFEWAGARMRQYWLDFACSGSMGLGSMGTGSMGSGSSGTGSMGTGSIGPGSMGPGWPRYSEAERRTLIFDEEDRIEADPRAEKRAAWERFLPGL